MKCHLAYILNVILGLRGLVIRRITGAAPRAPGRRHASPGPVRGGHAGRVAPRGRAGPPAPGPSAASWRPAAAPMRESSSRPPRGPWRGDQGPSRTAARVSPPRAGRAGVGCERRAGRSTSLRPAVPYRASRVAAPGQARRGGPGRRAAAQPRRVFRARAGLRSEDDPDQALVVVSHSRGEGPPARLFFRDRFFTPKTRPHFSPLIRFPRGLRRGLHARRGPAGVGDVESLDPAAPGPVAGLLGVPRRLRGWDLASRAIWRRRR